MAMENHQSINKSSFQGFKLKFKLFSPNGQRVVYFLIANDSKSMCLPVDAVSKSMAMMAFPFLSKLLDHRSVCRNPTSPRLFVNGL